MLRTQISAQDPAEEAQAEICEGALEWQCYDCKYMVVELFDRPIRHFCPQPAQTDGEARSPGPAFSKHLKCEFCCSWFSSSSSLSHHVRQTHSQAFDTGTPGADVLTPPDDVNARRALIRGDADDISPLCVYTGCEPCSAHETPRPNSTALMLLICFELS